MIGLPGAERERRLVAGATLLLVLSVQALRPHPLLESLGSRVVAPVARWIAPGAGRLAPPPVRAETAPEARPDPALAEWERRLGTPAARSGVVWLEVPVRSVRSGRLVLAAGRAFGLGPGQPVVFGSHWLGRIDVADDERAEVELWTASGARTGALLEGVEGSVDAVCEGSGGEAPPIVLSHEASGEPRAGAVVSWRARADDPPGLATLGLELGLLERRGDEARGEGHWVVAPALPAGADGRVFVAAGALPEDLAREPELQGAPLRTTLLADAILGVGPFAARSPGAGRVAVALDGGRVLGEVVARRGDLVWILPRAAESWHAAAVALDEREARLLRADELDPAARDTARLYTRGEGAVPRGLPLGDVEPRSPGRRPPALLTGVWR